jgi:hypothetical protein
MNQRFHYRGRIAILGCAVASIFAVAFPGAASAAAGGTSCGSRTIAVSAKGGKTVTVPVSRIRVEGGATCQEAIMVIRGFVKHEIPDGWAVGPGAFNVPHGLHAEIATNHHKKVKFALVGPS